MTLNFEALKKALRENDSISDLLNQPLVISRAMYDKLKIEFTEAEIERAVRDATGRPSFIISERIKEKARDEMKDHFFEGDINITALANQVKQHWPPVSDEVRQRAHEIVVEKDALDAQIDRIEKLLDLPSDDDIDIASVSDELHKRGTFEFTAEIKQVDSEKRIIEGFANTRNLDRVNDIIEPQAFESAIERVNSGKMKLLVEHWPPAIGHVISAKIKKSGFFIRAQIEKGIDFIDREWLMIEKRLRDDFSVGFRTLADRFENVKGRQVRIVTDLDLYEVSIVTIPANVQSTFSVVKGVLYGSDTFERCGSLWHPAPLMRHKLRIELNTKAKREERDVDYAKTLEYLRKVRSEIDEQQRETDDQEALLVLRELKSDL